MKKFFLSIVALAFTFGTVLSVNTASAQESASPSKVGFVDMAHVFKNYKKFQALRDDLKTEIQKSDQKAKSLATQIKTTQERMREFNEGSENYAAQEKKLTELQSDFQTMRKVAQRKFLRKEAEIYKTVYMEVSDVVKLFAQHYNYAVILRFSREGVGSSQNPKKVLQSMNRQVVYFNSNDDLTDRVVKYLNKRYSSETAGASAPKRN